MKMEIPIYFAGRPAGYARLWDEGLYRTVQAELPVCELLLRLHLCFDGQSVPAGVFVPDGPMLRCRRRFSRRSLPTALPTHAVACSDGKWLPDGSNWRRWLPDGWELAEPYHSGVPLQLACALDRIAVCSVAGETCLVYCGEYPVNR